MSQQAEKKEVHPGLGHQQGHGDQARPQAELDIIIFVWVPVGMRSLSTVYHAQPRLELPPVQELFYIWLCGAITTGQSGSEPGCGLHPTYPRYQL